MKPSHLVTSWLLASVFSAASLPGFAEKSWSGAKDRVEKNSSKHASLPLPDLEKELSPRELEGEESQVSDSDLSDLHGLEGSFDASSQEYNKQEEKAVLTLQKGFKRLKKKQGHEKARATDQTLSVETLNGTYSRSLSVQEVQDILKEKFSHLSALFSKEEGQNGVDIYKFIGSVQQNNNKGGASTDALYLVKDSNGKLIFIFKKVKNGNEEIANLLTMNRHKKLSNVPLDSNFPILSWIEKIYKYTDSQGNAHHLSAINSARGEPLWGYVDRVGPQANAAPQFKEVFYEVGRALASFNLYVADGNPSGSLNDLRKKLTFIHEDLKWDNIFIHKKPTDLGEGKAVTHQNHPYRIYLIDNESMMNQENNSYLRPRPGSVERDNVGGQLYWLYAFPLLRAQDIVTFSQEVVIAIAEGLSEGYASQFTDKESVRKEILTKIIEINNLYFDVLNNARDPKHQTPVTFNYPIEIGIAQGVQKIPQSEMKKVIQKLMRVTLALEKLTK